MQSGTLLAARYRLGSPIATGGMSAVYAATDERLGRPVAVKVMSRELCDDPETTKRFEREALAVARLVHPGIVQVFDYGEVDGTPFIVMERIEGRTLAQVLGREKRVDVERALAIGRGLLDALICAHEAGVVHRDLKPGNVMLVSGTNGERVKLIDFGIAHFKATSAYTRLTQSGIVLGTPAFMAPEQARGERLDERTDLYGVGVLLFCLLTGQRPFPVQDTATLLVAIQRDVPPRVDALAPATPTWLADAIARAQEKDPARRFASARQMIEALAGPTSSPRRVSFRRIEMASMDGAGPPERAPAPSVGPSGTMVGSWSARDARPVVPASTSVSPLERPAPMASPIPSIPIAPTALASSPIPSIPIAPTALASSPASSSPASSSQEPRRALPSWLVVGAWVAVGATGVGLIVLGGIAIGGVLAARVLPAPPPASPLPPPAVPALPLAGAPPATESPRPTTATSERAAADETPEALCERARRCCFAFMRARAGGVALSAPELDRQCPPMPPHAASCTSLLTTWSHEFAAERGSVPPECVP